MYFNLSHYNKVHQFKSEHYTLNFVYNIIAKANWYLTMTATPCMYEYINFRCLIYLYMDPL